ncbi:DEAD/DEAH box helicase [Candidatus Chloroploca sp. M-50]|uniref:DNA 3'-5' helicase n=1 Tax=Candidatus Chloroploca mongolica TaxID=2528176 RepID=A0ABS4DEX9_9CHLR|nr:3'-5' exonuclease [Candidatus Chloroploca mongolica]MBP1467981.1 DEAD/DEAH box helicase [Candidatus Chloroploca mongolica]
MATILPEHPVGSYPRETIRVFRLLKQLPDSFVIWQRLTIQDHGPSFLVYTQDERCALITVVPATLTDMRQAHQQGLFGATTAPGTTETEALNQFRTHLDVADALACIPGLILFPGIPVVDLQTALAEPPPGIVWGAREDLTSEAFLPWLVSRLGSRCTPEQFERLRRAFSPEIIIPCQLTIRQSLVRATEPVLTEYLLSYQQEWVLKYDLELSEEAEEANHELHLQLVNGVAGSGKSLLLLYRARLLRQFFPRKRMLVLTHNRPLIRDLQHRYHVLSGGDQGVEWKTFFGWCIAYWPTSPRPRLIKEYEQRALLQQAWEQHLADTSISLDLFKSEIDWLKDRLITTRQGYREADRSGRGFALKESMRDRVYEAILAYQHLLNAKGRLDFGDVPRRIWRALIEEDPHLPTYDVILIDEAQFFAPIWFAIIKRVLPVQRGQIFLVADPTQGFLKRRQSWLASGFNVRGHTRRLDRCYRTTREILAFATRFYQHRLPDDEEALIAANVQQTPSGLPPKVVALTSEQDELTRVVKEVKALVAAETPLEHILILHADWQGANRLLTRLGAEFGTAHVTHPKEGVQPEQIRVCQLGSATGLESPIVFLVGIHRLLEAEGSLRLSEEERAEQIRDNTRKLYMAMTRAGQRLVITYVGEVPRALGGTHT